MDLLPAGTKKVAVIDRCPLTEVPLYKKLRG